MKINPDCIRNVLLYLEENLKYIPNTLEHEPITMYKIAEDLCS